MDEKKPHQTSNGKEKRVNSKIKIFISSLLV